MIEIRTRAEVDRYLSLIDASANRTLEQVMRHTGSGLELLKALKFDQAGFHPVEDRPLNAIEQINQTWTYVAALVATSKLLELHPDAEGFRIAPGAHMSLPLDIMSIRPGLVGAETFAATHPRSNNKLNKDLIKLEAACEAHRYVFMMCPGLAPGRHERFERGGVQVWAVEPPT
ncbi:MAG: hypothetical protein HZY74_10265 [Brevundimonas sp.]|nr:MAG: hypothetical protein HZY74_10265 [Brevundimonas sp.]